MPWTKLLGGLLTDSQVALLGPAAELANDPQQLGYAAYVTATDVDNLIIMLTFIRDGVTPCPVRTDGGQSSAGAVAGKTNPITNATNASPIVITSAGHGLTTGKVVVIAGVGGNTAANGTWTVTVIDANTFSILPAGNGAYTSGGYWLPAVRNLSVPTQQIIGAIKPSDATSTALTTQEQILISGLMNDGDISLTNADGSDNNNVKHIRKLVTAGSPSDLAITGLENRNGARLEILLGVSGVTCNEIDMHNALQK